MLHAAAKAWRRGCIVAPLAHFTLIYLAFVCLCLRRIVGCHKDLSLTWSVWIYPSLDPAMHLTRQQKSEFEVGPRDCLFTLTMMHRTLIPYFWPSITLYLPLVGSSAEYQPWTYEKLFPLRDTPLHLLYSFVSPLDRFPCARYVPRLPVATSS